MSKKLILVLIGIIFFFNFHKVYAEVVINEIMYNPVGSDTNVEWVEIQNTGNSSIDLSTWYIADYDTLWHFHAITPENSNILNAGAYALIVHTSQANFADFKTKMPNFNGLLFRASFALGNDTGRLGMSSDHTNISSDTTYTATADTSDTGNSLQLISGSWIGATATPGVENRPSSSITSTSGGPLLENNVNSNTNLISTTDTLNKTTTQEQNIKTKITVKTPSFVGLPLSFKATSFGYADEELFSGKYFWNFGDGSSTEMTNNVSFSHTYFYPGDYVISVSYYLNPYSQIPDVVNKIKIKIVPFQLSISGVGDAQDFFVELFNNSDYDMDLSNWSLSSGGKIFLFPRDTNILAKNKIILSSQITHFNLEDKDNLILLSPSGKIVSKFYENNNIAEKVPEIKNEEIDSKIENNNVNFATVKTLEEKIPAENLTSSTINTDVIPTPSLNEQENSSNFYIFSIILLVFLSISGGVVYFIRRNSAIFQPQNDFEILDE